MLTASTTGIQALSGVNRQAATTLTARVQGASGEKEKAALSAAFF